MLQKPRLEGAALLLLFFGLFSGKKYTKIKEWRDVVTFRAEKQNQTTTWKMKKKSNDSKKQKLQVCNIRI